MSAMSYLAELQKDVSAGHTTNLVAYSELRYLSGKNWAQHYPIKTLLQDLVSMQAMKSS